MLISCIFTGLASLLYSATFAIQAIFMQRGTGGEGLYTLKSLSSTDEQTSYTVAFEDRVDAANFCYLLESFFEDLGDFKADVVPLTVKVSELGSHWISSTFLMSHTLLRYSSISRN